MGCNCGKMTVPAGFGRPVPSTDAPGPATADDDAGKGRQRFTLRTSSRRTQVFASRLEAEAARVRAGGGSISAR